MIVLLLVLLCVTAWGQDAMRDTIIDEAGVTLTKITGAEGNSTLRWGFQNVPDLPDSLCATCGDTCRVVQVPCPSYGGIQTLQICYAPRCPQHGRHAEWINETWKARADSIYGDKTDWSVQWWIESKRGLVELGLREDGVVVWRKK